jgi:hypothetical protein
LVLPAKVLLIDNFLILLFYSKDSIHGAVHTLNNHGSRAVSSATRVTGVSSGFHVYKLDWSPAKIIISVDNKPFFTYSKSNNAGYNSWPFDNYFNIVLSTAVGGQQGIEDAIFPQTFAIDYIKYKAYRRDGSISSVNWKFDLRANSKWAPGCDWMSNDMGSVQVRVEHCAMRCKVKPMCTHFTWTEYSGGTCWMKSGRSYLSSLLLTGVPSSSQICGFLL